MLSVRRGEDVLLLTLRTTKRPAETPDPGSAVQIDTLESGRILVSNPDVGVVGDVPNLELNVELRLGAVDGDSPEVFGDVRSLAADDRGTIYVADVQAAEIRVFDSQGRSLRRFGRRGEGPGLRRLDRRMGPSVSSIRIGKLPDILPGFNNFIPSLSSPNMGPESDATVSVSRSPLIEP